MLLADITTCLFIIHTEEACRTHPACACLQHIFMRYFFKLEMLEWNVQSSTRTWMASIRLELHTHFRLRATYYLEYSKKVRPEGKKWIIKRKIKCGVSYIYSILTNVKVIRGHLIFVPLNHIKKHMATVWRFWLYMEFYVTHLHVWLINISISKKYAT